MANHRTYLIVALAAVAAIAVFLTLSACGAGDNGDSTVEQVRAEGDCVECHRSATPGLVETYEEGPHVNNITCLDCHNPREGLETMDHNGFEVVRVTTAGHCAECHEDEYDQHVSSRHGAPAWAAVAGNDTAYDGREPFTAEQIAMVPEAHQAAVNRGGNPLAAWEGAGAVENGCAVCHEIGAPNADGSVGNCSKCHLRHTVRVDEARLPETCGSCHMGPDHAMLEIYNESTHGVLFSSMRDDMNLGVTPSELTTKDMPVPTCSTCHMSGLNDATMTHDVTERLSYYLFAPISKERPDGAMGRENMKEICLNCHGPSHIEEFYADADLTLHRTNEMVAHVKEIVDGLYADGFAIAGGFDDLLDYKWFDYWHYFGRTAKHGAYMGGPDYTQWHGNYELSLQTFEFEELDAEMRGH
ncbi:hypothetical protein K8R78_03005 [bacterium]|nr:hypothetical protein [bacterium]